MLEAIALCIASIHDGDSLRTCDGTRVRMAAIDAPEFENSPRCTDPRRRARAVCDNALAARSRDALAALLAQGALCVDEGPDIYERRLYRCTVNGTATGLKKQRVSIGNPFPLPHAFLPRPAHRLATLPAPFAGVAG